jgi:gliding motility-associated-like protein
MKKITIIFLLTQCLLLFSTQTKATHAVGMNLSYEYVGPNQYIVTVKFYRNCGDAINPNPAPAPMVMTVYFSSAISGQSGNLDLNQVAGTGQEIPTGQFPPCAVTACNGGTGYGVQEYVYSGLVTLPSAQSDWVIGAYVTARNAIITTLSGPGGLSLYVNATLNSDSFPMNSSPVFSTYPVSRFCINHTFHFNQGATDPDGDSLVYSLADALTTTGFPPTGTPVPYVGSYTGANPISSNPPVSIDSTTGVITLTPNLIQVGVIAILIQEYRNGVLIGTTRRDMQVNIEATCNFPPVLEPATFNNITANCGDTVLYLHLTTPVKCNSIAPDGSDFRMLSPSGGPIPIIAAVGINCVGGLTDSIRIRLYPPNLTENGWYYLWSKKGNDGNTLLNGCNNAMAEYDTASFFFNNCYSGVVDLTNVSVDNPNSKMEVYWDIPLNLPLNQFHSFDIYRSDYPGGPYNGITSVTSPTANSYIDGSVNVPLKPYDYAIRIHLNTGYIAPFSDSIQSIFLTGTQNADSLTLNLNWTPYWGWPNPRYQVMESDDYGNTFFPVDGDTTSNTSIVYTKPDKAGSYLVRIHTTSGNLLSRSNWYRFDVVKSAVMAPNIFTPNGDGVNDAFVFQNLEFYPNSKLTIFNRWGLKVYESSNYLNDWKGDNLSEGVYYYTLKIADKNSTVKTGTVNIIRNK